MSSLPSLLPYPKIDALTKEHPINGVFSYIQEMPQLGGLALVIKMPSKSGEVAFKPGKWDGSAIPDESMRDVANFVGDVGVKLANIMYLVKVDQAIFYISNDHKLVDVRTSLNKWLGPGMVENVFSKVISTPRTIEIASITDDVYNAIMSNKGKYSGNLLIKPSRPRGDDVKQVYATVVR